MKILKAYISFIIALSAVSCSELEDADSVTADDILLLTVTKSEILNNGREFVNVWGRLPKDAGSVDITFIATGGTFVFSNDKTVKQMADSVAGNYRFARVTLKADSTEGQKYITAEITSARRRVTLNFVK